ncbi:MAG: RNA polymerase sigma factor [Planctomycetes bacterium]|nr:RNA polymerase sigma factor [Planctomycetota bacterium]
MTQQEQLVSLMQAHQAGVWRYLRMLGCQPSQADDLTQEVFISVMQKPFDDHGRASTAAYLRLAAKHAFIDSLRSAGAKLAVGNLDEADAAWAEVTPEEDNDRRQDALRLCLEQLPERARKAVQLRYADDADGARIAAALETSEDGVKALLARTRGQLRECIERKLEARHE